MDPHTPFALESAPAARETSFLSTALRLLLHALFLVIALACLAGYEHFATEQQPTASLVSLVAAAAFGFLPLRDLVRVVFKVGGATLHAVHIFGGLGLVALPLTGVISGTSVLTHAAMAPFSMMGAAQALTHSNQPRNAKQAEALRQFATSLPEVAQIAGMKTFASPDNAARAVAVLTDILAKAQALGQTELDADPNFQSALRQASTRFGASLGLDAVDIALRQLEANPATARAVPALRTQLAAARRAIAGPATHS